MANPSPDVPLPIEFDTGRHHRAKLGFVLLAMEQTVESEMQRYAPAGVGLHFTRAPMANAVTSKNLRAMLGGLANASSLILPDGDLDVVCYACTSGSLVIGEERVLGELKRGAPNAVATSLISGVIRGLRALDARRIVVATPYLDEVNLRELEYLQQAGFDVLSICGLNLEKDSDMVRVAPDFLVEFALAQDHPDADAIFVSCGALRTLEVVQEIEARAGKPVVCSNQAMIWDCLRLAGIDDRLPGYGRLLTDY